MVNKGRVVLLRKLFYFLWDQSRQSCSRSQSEYRIFFILPTHRFNHVVNLLSSSDWLELLIAFESCDWPEKFLYLFLFCGTNKKHLQKLWLNLQITEELETVKAQMDERGTNMTDAGGCMINQWLRCTSRILNSQEKRSLNNSHLKVPL